MEKNKGESSMKSLLFVLSQLTLVTLVYAFAYRAGYRSAQSKAMSVVRKFADPVACLFDQLTESMDEAKENAHPTSNIERSTSNDKMANFKYPEPFYQPFWGLRLISLS
jgi:hypothetical protein